LLQLREKYPIYLLPPNSPCGRLLFAAGALTTTKIPPMGKIMNRQRTLFSLLLLIGYSFYPQAAVFYLPGRRLLIQYTAVPYLSVRLCGRRNDTMGSKIISSSAMADIDREAIEGYGIPGILLMEHAAAAVVSQLKKLLRVKKLSRSAASLLFIAGPGNNGGDALAAARIAAGAGYAGAAVLLVQQKLHETAALQLTMVRNLGIPVYLWDDPETEAALRRADCIIDGISGTGLTGDLRGRAGEAAEKLRFARESGELKAAFLAVDIPSGMHEAGTQDSPLVPADVTVTMGLRKTACYLLQTRHLCGKIVCINPGFPRELLENAHEDALLAEDEDAVLLPLKLTAYKNSRGHAAVFAGSPQTPGAALLSASAAAHMRAGLITLYTALEAARPVLSSIPAAIIPLPVESETDRRIIGRQELQQRFTAVLAGPGWGTGEQQAAQLKEILASELPVILDADALTLLAAEIRQNRSEVRRTSPLILTPHPGEFERLSGVPAGSPGKVIIASLREFAREFSCIVIYKAHLLYIAAPDGRVTVAEGLNPAMGTAGSGDVLAGCAAGLLCSGHEAYKAAVTATYLHQKAGRVLYRRNGIFTADQLIPVLADLAR
jgi:ADP-dependent NAD(P)H-hydrate dehydratase / NAD(P)H-hydrate epimerase